MDRFEAAWNRIEAHAGKEFWTKTGLPFSYKVIGANVIPDRTGYPLHASNFRAAFDRLPFSGPGQINAIVQGPAAMRLAGSADALTLRVTGYQFPDAQDLRKRYSWHMVEGEAACPRGAWRFRFPALTCDESPRISAWLREVAGYAGQSPVSGQPGVLEFTEPNLRFSPAGRQPGDAALQVALDLEFQPPWHRRRAAGDPFCLVMHLTAEQLRSAAGSGMKRSPVTQTARHIHMTGRGDPKDRPVRGRTGRRRGYLLLGETFPRKRFVKPCTSRFRGNVRGAYGVSTVRPVSGMSVRPVGCHARGPG